MRKNNRYKVLFLVLLTILCLFAVALLILKGAKSSGGFNPSYEGKTVWHNGVAYYPRQDISLFLVMGIDRKGEVEDSGSYNNSGAADAVMLVVFDETTRTFDVLAFNRDSMVDIPVLSLNGKPIGTVNAQLALSHTYGSGLHDSSENALKTVSDLLCGIPIYQYMTMNMDVVSILNDSVGGVRVNVTDDFSMVDSTIHMGEITLNGSQALNYIQMRKDVSDGLNISRMKRQEEYMKGFVEAFQKSGTDDFLDALDTYEKIKPYVVTNCSDKALSALLDKFNDYQFDEVISPEGENVKGEVYMEFHIDPEKLLDLTLELLYEPK